MSKQASEREQRMQKLAKLRAAAAALEEELAAEQRAAAPAASAPSAQSTSQKTAQYNAKSGEAAKRHAKATGQVVAPTGASTNGADRTDQAATLAANAARDGEPQDEDAAEEEFAARSLPSLLRDAPAWLVSLIAHLILLIVLGLWTFSIQEKREVFMLESPVAEAEDELEELTEFEAAPVESLELKPELALETILPDPGQIALGEFATSETTPVAEIGELAAPSSIQEIGAIFGTDGKGMAELGDGFKGAATFFGSKVKGKRFVFVVDNSNSMGRGRMETALAELMRSVQAMDRSQRFYVIFFSDTAYGLFHPDTVRSMQAATAENKRKLEYWLPTVQMCLRTQGREAILAALRMEPDAIYILSDGVFTDKAGDLLTAPHSRRTVIHTLGMEVDPRGAKQLEAIARANRGTYKAVAASTAARAAAKNKPIPRNNTRGKVWGIKLPAKGKKKK